MKKYKSIYEREKEYRIGFFVLFGVILISNVFILLITLHLPNQNQGIEARNIYSQVKINYVGEFTPEEKNVLGEIIYDVDKKYSQFVREINFTKNIKDVMNFCSSSSPDTVGCNYRDRIVLFYDDYSEDWVRMAICHEILHSIILSGDETHKIVYDLGNKQVCFSEDVGLRF